MTNMAAPFRTQPSQAAAPVLFVLVLVVLAFTWGWVRDRDARALASLPPETRVELYARTMANLSTVCVGQEGRKLESFCKEQAEIALRLPECDAGCDRVARALLVYPTR